METTQQHTEEQETGNEERDFEKLLSYAERCSERLRSGEYTAQTLDPMKTAEECRESMYSAISDGDNLKDQYGITDRARVAWASVLETAASVPGFPKKNKNAVCDETLSIDGRIIKEKILEYRAGFQQQLKIAANAITYCEGQLGCHSKRKNACGNSVTVKHNEIIAYEESISGLEARLAYAKEELDKTPDLERRESIANYICQNSDKIDTLRLSLDKTGIALEKDSRMAKVHSVLYAALHRRYICLQEMYSLISQKGELIDQTLKDWENNASVEHLGLMKHRLEKCEFVKRHIDDLDAKQLHLEQEAIVAKALSDGALDNAAESAKRYLNRHGLESSAQRRYVYEKARREI